MSKLNGHRTVAHSVATTEAEQPDDELEQNLENNSPSLLHARACKKDG